MPDAHKMALVLRLLEAGIPMGVAALTADAVHLFAELGRWTPDRKAEKAVHKISKEVAQSIGRGTLDVSAIKAKTRWAFQQYASLVASGSDAGSIWQEAAERAELD